MITCNRPTRGYAPSARCRLGAAEAMCQHQIAGWGGRVCGQDRRIEIDRLPSASGVPGHQRRSRSPGPSRTLNRRTDRGKRHQHEHSGSGASHAPILLDCATFFGHAACASRASSPPSALTTSVDGVRSWPFTRWAVRSRRPLRSQPRLALRCRRPGTAAAVPAPRAGTDHTAD